MDGGGRGCAKRVNWGFPGWADREEALLALFFFYCWRYDRVLEHFNSRRRQVC